ncbi:MAG TPA: DNA/RNA non-specific endonuclease [Treponema sp.]|nr:DNA/RNA non-specific endonuclease [Treponema sp.]
MKRLYVFAVSVIFLFLHNALFAQSELFLLPQGFEIPLCAEAHEDSPDHEIHEYSAFTLCYRESYELAEWVCYELTREELTKNVKRTNSFRPDEAITTGSASLEDYRNSGYDRGHLAPSGDMLFSQEANLDCFLLSNITPQNASFNSGIWNELENQVRRWAEEYGRVFVITGPVLEKSPSEYQTIGSNKVVVPEYFYKIVLTPVYADEADALTPQDCSRIIVSAYIIPNKKCSDRFWNYKVSVSEVERRTGLDFFSLLDYSD